MKNNRIKLIVLFPGMESRYGKGTTTVTATTSVKSTEDTSVSVNLKPKFFDKIWNL